MQRYYGSPPTRGRGLKLFAHRLRHASLHSEPESPPTRGRGLKQSWLSANATINRYWPVSPPTRGRGLKQSRGTGHDELAESPPTLKPHWRITQTPVAPHAGAWIETDILNGRTNETSRGSPPTRGRGLKHVDGCSSWIRAASTDRSPPTRGRGLKHKFLALKPGTLVRGRWHATDRATACRHVAPHAGAWIETTRSAGLPADDAGRPPRGGAD